jgi:hypothetical protein
MNNSQRSFVSTFAGRTMPTHNQNLQKSFQIPVLEKRNFKKCPTAQVVIENENKNEKKIKHESTTKMCTVHSTLQAATTPCTERYLQA